MRKQGDKNADGMPDRWQQVSVIAQDNLKLATFLFHYWWKSTFDWVVTGVCKDTVHFLAGWKKLEDEYKVLNVLPNINKSDMAGTMEPIKEYHRSCHGAIRAPLAYIMRKTVTVQTMGDYPMCATPDNKIIARM